MASKRRRVSAEGMLVALEFLSVVAMRSEGHKSGTGKSADNPIKVTVDLRGSEARVENFGALVFALVHPWIELHTDRQQCETTDEDHETEYSEMLEIVEKAIEESNRILAED